MTWDYRSVAVTRGDIPGTSQDFHNLGLQEYSCYQRGYPRKSQGHPRISEYVRNTLTFDGSPRYLWRTHPSLVTIVYLQNGVFFFAFIYCLYTHTHTHYTFFHYFHMCAIHFLLWMAMQHFFLLLFLVYHFVWRLVLHMSMQDIVIT